MHTRTLAYSYAYRRTRIHYKSCTRCMHARMYYMTRIRPTTANITHIHAHIDANIPPTCDTHIARTDALHTHACTHARTHANKDAYLNARKHTYTHDMRHIHATHARMIPTHAHIQNKDPRTHATQYVHTCMHCGKQCTSTYIMRIHAHTHKYMKASTYHTHTRIYIYIYTYIYIYICVYIYAPRAYTTNTCTCAHARMDANMHGRAQ